MKFRHLLDEHDLGKALFEDINERLDKAGLMMHGGRDKVSADFMMD